MNKIELKEAIKLGLDRNRVSRAEAAKCLGIDRTQLSRFLNNDHGMRTDRLLELLDLAGIILVFKL